MSGCNNHYESVLRAESKAKSVTNNLPILSVLALVLLFNYLTVRVLSAVPDCMYYDFVLSNLIVDYVIFDNKSSGSFLCSF